MRGKEEMKSRLTDSVETASNLSGGIVVISVLGDSDTDGAPEASSRRSTPT
jgi:hypothetical protein